MRKKPQKGLLILGIFIVLLFLMNSACTKSTEAPAENQAEHSHGEAEGEHTHAETSEKQAEHSHGEGEGEHSHDEAGEEHGEGHSEEGEESGETYAKDTLYNKVRKGVRLTLKYDPATSSFNGSVENTTDKVIKSVRVEIHLSNGKELGPTKSMDLNPGQKATVKLSAEGQEFEWYKAHPESGTSEH